MGDITKRLQLAWYPGAEAMTDIVARLRHEGVEFNEQLEAADEIDRLREQVAALQASSGYEASIAQVEIDRLREEVETWKSHYDAERREHEDTLKAWQEERSGL